MSQPVSPLPPPITHENAGRVSLRDASREFECMLIGTLLRQASQPIAGGSLLDGGSAGRMYRELFYQEIARIAAHRDDLGLGDLVQAASASQGGSAS